jgi:hypothetical protein
MKLRAVFLGLLILGLSIQCAPKSTFVKNIDANAPIPVLSHKNKFKITEMAPDAKYGYSTSYPINVFYVDAMNDTINAKRFLNALAGPNGEKIAIKRQESCCPFPTKNHPLGAGMLEAYEVTWQGNKKPLILYFNVYERGNLYIPKGLTAKKED